MRYLMAVGLLALLGSTACTRGPKGLSRATYESTQSAVAAIQRANEYRDAGTLLFEPRFLEAEKAIDDVASTQKNFSDSAAVMQMRVWLTSMKQYRDILDKYEAVLEDPALKARVGEWSRLRQESAANLDKSLQEMRSLL
jgi:hypothetical protein